MSYFLHEKCFLLAMNCLKKVALLSLDSKLPLLELDTDAAMEYIRTREFNFAFAVAVGYDLDNDQVWAESLYHHVVKKNNLEFMQTFLKYKAMSGELIEAVVNRYEGDQPSLKEKKAMKDLVSQIPNLIERYKTALRLNFSDPLEALRMERPVVAEWCTELFQE
jgi:hypothetical protein